jgi:MscS family membrane protein
MIKNKLARINRTIIFFSILFLVLFLIFIAVKQEYIEINSQTENIIKNLFISVLTLLTASIFIKFTNTRFLNYFKSLQTEQKLLLTKTYSFVIYFFALMFILGSIGVTIQNITLIIGIAATGLAFTIKEILINYFAWYMFLTKKPFRIGDFVEIDNIEGKVIHIGTFYVLLDETPEDSTDYIKVPNKKFLEHSIINLGKSPFTFKIIYPLFREVNIKKLEKIEKEIKSYIKTELKIELISDDLSVKLLIKGKVKSYEERNELRTKIIKKLIEEFPFKS